MFPFGYFRGARQSKFYSTVNRVPSGYNPVEKVPLFKPAALFDPKMERLLRFVVVSFPVTTPSNSEETTDTTTTTTPSDTTVVATNTVAISEMTPQDDVRLEIQSQEEFRSADSETGQS